VANVIRYEGEEKNRSFSSSPFQQNLNSIINANAFGDLVSSINSRGLLPLPSGYVDTASVETEGWEFELTANVTQNWRLMVNAAMPKATQTDANQESQAYWEKNRETLRLIIQDAGGTFVGDLATFTGVPPPGQSSSEGQNAVNAWNGNVVAFASRADGQKLNRLTEVTANVFTDYTFQSGRFKGLRIGAGLNYRGRQIIGTRGGDTIRNPASPNSAIDNPDVGAFDYVYADPYTIGTLTFNYSHRINRKYTVSFDLRINNVLDHDEPLYINTVARPIGGDLANPGREETPSRFSWATPRSFTFTTTLRF
jgi:hypothetical protein